MRRLAATTFALLTLLVLAGAAAGAGGPGRGNGNGGVPQFPQVPGNWTHVEINVTIKGTPHTLILDRGRITQVSRRRSSPSVDATGPSP
jgi:hypothetical protein